MNNNAFFDYILAKINTRAFSVLGALILISGGFYMCYLGLSTNGSINIKSAVIEGRIETGSLGIMAMFLGAIILLVLNLSHPYKGQEIKITINGKEIIAKSLSHKTLTDFINLALLNDQIENNELFLKRTNSLKSQGCATD